MRNVLIVDDHEVTPGGIRETLLDAFQGIEIHGASDARSMLAALPERPWDLILLDVMMPGRTTILELLRMIRTTDLTVPILVLTAAADVECVAETMKAGANGLVHKHRASDDLAGAIEAISGGGSYLHPETASAVTAALRDEAPSLPHQKLSERELEIFRLIALGRAVKEIAVALGLSDKTVATYVSRIREKTGLESPVDMARYALHKGLVQ